MLSIVAAMGLNDVIGKANQLPWRLPEDLKRFRQFTMNKPVIMGRKTFESLGAPLRGRTNIVLSTQRDYAPAGVQVSNSLSEAIELAYDFGEEVMVIGGARVYAQALPRAERMYLTYVEGEFDGDAFFPAFDKGLWRKTKHTRFDADERNAYAQEYFELERVQSVVNGSATDSWTSFSMRTRTYATL